MALWVLHAKCFGGESENHEFRRYYNSDSFLLGLRAKNLMGPFHKLPLLSLARAMETVKDDLAAVMACYLFEIAIREKARSFGRAYEGGTKLSDVLKGMSGRVEEAQRDKWRTMKRIRDNLFHKNVKPTVGELQDLLKEVESIAKTLPDIHLGRHTLV